MNKSWIATIVNAMFYLLAIVVGVVLAIDLMAEVFGWITK